jgi:hypothetical protein
MFLLTILVVVFCCFQTISGQANSYGTTCVCTQTSTSGSFCWAWKCQTDQIAAKCFASDSTVEIIQSNQRKSMKDINIGDEILVDINDRGQRIYEPVYGFIHANPNGMYDYLKIIVENNVQQPLIISNNHLIYRFNQSQPIFAGYLKIGDRLQMIFNNGSKQGASIMDIKLIKSQGYYAPLTYSGKLVVDGIVVSNYATIANHHLAHLAIQPYRWWIYWIGSSSYSENIHWYCQFLYNLGQQINKWLFSIELYDGSFFVSKF